MSADILNKLAVLQENSYKKLNRVVRSSIQSNTNPRTLVKNSFIANGNIAVVPVKGASSLLTENNRSSVRRVKVFTPGTEHIVKSLNKELLGGESYPILTTALSIAGGVISGGGSILFSVLNTGLSLANTASNVLARPGDEIWHQENFGRVGDKVIYVSAYFIVDPYRKQAHNKGWLIHEERDEVTLT